jgi:hypothetical protein
MPNIRFKTLLWGLQLQEEARHQQEIGGCVQENVQHQEHVLSFLTEWNSEKEQTQQVR